MSEGAAHRRGFDKGAFFRLCRMLHAYASAFAFLSLMFFSVTGVMLNHPGWFEALILRETSTTVQLTPAQIAAARAAPDPSRALVAVISKTLELPGTLSSGDVMDDRALVRLDGPKGSTDLNINLATGVARVRIERPDLMLIIQDLHRGKNSGAAWRWVIDLTAYLVVALSVIGFVLLFTLRFRLRTSLVLAGLSLVAMVAVVALLIR